VPTCDQVPVPAQHRVRPHQQSYPVKCLWSHAVQQRCQEGAVGPGEPHLPAVQPAFQHRDLMTQNQDLGVLVPVAYRKKTQQRERVRHGQVGQSQQHSRSSCRGDRFAVTVPVLGQTTKPGWL
jgi:hypothetical protein